MRSKGNFCTETADQKRIFDSYYVLPQRPDLAALFCWQAINHSYYVQQLSDNSVGFCLDTKDVEFVRGAILANWNNKYKAILEPFLEGLPDKTFHYVASYMLKGYAMEKNGMNSQGELSDMALNEVGKNVNLML